MKTVQGLSQAILGVLGAQVEGLTSDQLALKGVIDGLVQEIDQFLAGVVESRVSVLVDLPCRLEDLVSYDRGVEGFINRITGSFYDQGDVNRPRGDQGISGALVIGVIGTDEVGPFLTLLRRLRLFMSVVPAIAIPAPVRLRAYYVDQARDRILDEAVLRSGVEIAAVRFEWDEPGIAGRFLGIFRSGKVLLEGSLSGGRVIRDAVTGQRLDDEQWEQLLIDEFKFDVIEGRFFLDVPLAFFGEERYYRIRIVDDEARIGGDFKGIEASAPVLMTGDVVASNFDFITAWYNVYRVGYGTRHDQILDNRASGSIRKALQVGDLDQDYRGQVGFTSDPIGVYEGEGAGAIKELDGSFDPFGGQDEAFEPVLGQGLGERIGGFSDGVALGILRRGLRGVTRNRALIQSFKMVYDRNESKIVRILEGGVVFSDMADQVLARDIALMIDLITGVSSGSVRPDWLPGARVFRNVFPSIGSAMDEIRDLAASVSAYVAFPQAIVVQGGSAVLEEMIRVLEGILTRLETFVTIVEAFNVTVTILYLAPASGGAVGVADRIAGALQRPVTGPRDYAGGIVLYASGADIQAFVRAMNFLFGI
jgi:hypothetical protein